MIVGVWLEEGRLTVHNGDLTGRIVSVNADKWTQDELLQVINCGEAMLNIELDEQLKSDLLDECFESVYIVQEACYKCCKDYGVHQTQVQNKIIGDTTSAKALVKIVVDEQSGRYTSFISQFASGFQETTLQMYKWLLLPVLVNEVQHLEEGLRLADIRKLL